MIPGVVTNAVLNAADKARHKADVDAAVQEHVNKGFWRLSWRPMQAKVPAIHFDAFIESFADNWSTNFNQESVFGRMDPIYTFQNTQRRMQLSFAVPSVSVEHGIENLNKFERLISFLYPSYEMQSNGQQTMAAPPILQLRFGNLAANPSGGPGVNADGNADPKDGLLVAVGGFSMNPNLDLGFYHPHKGQFVPKAFTVDVDMGIIHRHMLGWNGNEFLGGSYPYNTQGKKPSSDRIGAPKPNDYGQNKQAVDKATPVSTGEIPANLGPEQNESISVAEVELMSKTPSDYQIEQEQQQQIFSDPDDPSNYMSGGGGE